MLEVKSLTFTSSGVLGTYCALAQLSEYPDVNTLKCKVANIGDELTPIYVSPIGTPYFSEDDFKKYSKGNHYARIYVEFQYDVKEQELPAYVYNTDVGITNHIKDMKSLYEIIYARQIGKKKGVELDCFYWRGLLFFDKFGQVMGVNKVEYKDTLKPWVLKDIKENAIPDYSFRDCCECWSISGVSLPRVGEKCEYCGEEWTIDNLEDFIVERKDSVKEFGYHKSCYKSMIEKRQKEEFMELFKGVYNLSEKDFTAIPNEYCKCDRCTSWFKVKTPDGLIKLGWRKRVIEITWLDSYKRFRERFENEDVTKKLRKEIDDRELHADIRLKWGSGSHGFYTPSKEEVTERYIHAWGTDKAKEYLLRAKRSIIKPQSPQKGGK